jgi:hypothetical protein
MKTRVFASALALSTLAVAPVAVQAAPIERGAAPTAEESDLRGSLLWVVAAIAAVIAAILLLGDDEPASP